MNTPVEILEQQVKLLKETIEIQNKLIDVLRGSQVQNIFQGHPQYHTTPNIIPNPNYGGWQVISQGTLLGTSGEVT